MKTLSSVFLFFLLTCSLPSHSQVTIEGATDCGQWVEARKYNQAIAFEHYVLGSLNGWSLGTNREFWVVRGMSVSRAAVFLWLDNYCQRNPLDHLNQGIRSLFIERSGWQPSAKR